MSRVLNLEQAGADRCAAAAASVLLSGGLVVCPTDTLYGLLCIYSSEEAVERLYTLKGRDQEKKLIALVPDSDSAAGLCSRLLPGFAREHWPGPLTIILPSEKKHPLGWPTQAVRVPADPWLRTLLHAVGEPLFAPSANPQGRPPAVTIAEAQAYFEDSVGLYVDGGHCPSGTKPSTLITLEEGVWKILREGAIPADQLQEGLM